MAKIISVHSFRGGTGKSNLTANLAVSVARAGKRVGVVDTDIQSPGIHVLFGLAEEKLKYSLNDYLWGQCSIEQTACEVMQRPAPDRTIRHRFLASSSSLPVSMSTTSPGCCGKDTTWPS